MKFKYEFRSPHFASETEMFTSKEEYIHRFRNADELFHKFIEDEEIDMLKFVVGGESHTIYRIYDNEV